MTTLQRTQRRGFENITNSPQFPGQQKGKSIEEVRAFIREQVRRKGFRFTGGTTSVKFNIDLTGDACFLWGVAFLNNTFGICQLTINNEVVIEDTDTGFLQFGLTEQDYFAVNRPLSGTDKISITIVGDAAYQDEPFIVYYK